MRLDADQIAMYLRLVVDLRCPPPGAPRDISTLLRQKYNMAPRRYVAITRVLAANPALLRDLSDEAEGRCQELAKLRAVLPGDRVVGLHEAVLCGPGVTPVTRRAKRKLARIWRRFDVDSSWYRPLLLATREDPAHTEALLAIDRRCSTAEEVQP